MIKRAFGDLELEILNLFSSGKRMTVKQIQSLLGGQDKYTTIMTVMQRLAEKNKLSRERIGLQYEYWLVPKDDQSISLIQQMKKKIFGLKTSAVVNYLIQSGDDLTDQDLIEIEKMIQAAKDARKKS